MLTLGASCILPHTTSTKLSKLPHTHNFHKKHEEKIHSLPDFLKKLWILNFPPSFQGRKVKATWAGTFWAKTLELELLDKSIISRAPISITILTWLGHPNLLPLGVFNFNLLVTTLAMLYPKGKS